MSMARISCLLPLLLMISLLFLSLSLPTSAHEHHHQAALIPHTRVLTQHQQHFHEGRRLLSSFQQPRKLKIYMKKRVSGSGTGIATRARGKTSAAFRTTQLSSFQVASVLGSSLLLGFFVL